MKVFRRPNVERMLREEREQNNNDNMRLHGTSTGDHPRMDSTFTFTCTTTFGRSQYCACPPLRMDSGDLCHS